jgi:predicted porin
VIGIGDIFNSSQGVRSNETYLGNSFGLRMDNSLVYTTPNWSGFSAQAMLVMNGLGARRAILSRQPSCAGATPTTSCPAT